MQHHLNTVLSETYSWLLFQTRRVLHHSCRTLQFRGFQAQLHSVVHMQGTSVHLQNFKHKPKQNNRNETTGTKQPKLNKNLMCCALLTLCCIDVCGTQTFSSFVPPNRLLCLQYNLSYSLRLCLQENTDYSSNFRSKLPKPLNIAKWILQKHFAR